MNEDFGIFIDDLEIILEAGEIVAIPKAPDFIMGVYNHRGRIITVIDLALFLGIARSERDASSRIIVLYTESTEFVQIGLFVSEVQDFLSITEEQLKEPPPQTGGDQSDKFVQKVLEHDNKLISILDSEAIITYFVNLGL